MPRTKKVKDTNTVTVDGVSYSIIEVVERLTRVVTKSFLVKDIYQRWTEETMVPDGYLQRMIGQWCRKQDSHLISAMLHNRSIGTVIIATGRTCDCDYTVYSILDGLQRIYAITNFINNKFKLDKNEPPVVCRIRDSNGNIKEYEFEIAGKYFKSLPKVMQNAFLDYGIRVDSYENFTNDELDDIIFCVNNGKSPTAYQKMRFLLGTDNMCALTPIYNSTLWEDIKGCKAKNDSTLGCITRMLIMMSYYNYTNLGSATMTKFIDTEFDEYVKKSDIEALTALVEELAEVKFKLTDEEVSRFDSLTLPHYVVGLRNFEDIGGNASEYTEFLRKFWESDFYASFVAACDSNGSGGSLYSAQAIDNRQNAISEFFEEYFDTKSKAQDDTSDIENEDINSDTGDNTNNIINGIADDVINDDTNENVNNNVNDGIDNNGDEVNGCKRDEYSSECDDTAGKTQGAGSCDSGNNEAEECHRTSENDFGALPSDSNGSRQTGETGQEEPTYSVYISGSEQVASFNRCKRQGQQVNTCLLQ